MPHNLTRKIKRNPKKSIITTAIALFVWVVLRESLETWVSATFNIEGTIAGILVGTIFILGWLLGIQKISKS